MLFIQNKHLTLCSLSPGKVEGTLKQVDSLWLNKWKNNFKLKTNPQNKLQLKRYKLWNTITVFLQNQHINSQYWTDLESPTPPAKKT